MSARDISEIVGVCAGAVSVCWSDINKAGEFDSSQASKHVDDALAEIAAAGYRKPKVVGYIVVDRDGDVIGRKFTVHEAAQAFADEWTADCKTAGIDWDYRVAEIFEPHQ